MDTHYADVYRQCDRDTVTGKLSVTPAKNNDRNQTAHQYLNPDEGKIALLHEACHQLISFRSNPGSNPDDGEDRIKQIERKQQENFPKQVHKVEEPPTKDPFEPCIRWNESPAYEAGGFQDEYESDCRFTHTIVPKYHEFQKNLSVTFRFR